MSIFYTQAHAYRNESYARPLLMPKFSTRCMRVAADVRSLASCRRISDPAANPFVLYWLQI